MPGKRELFPMEVRVGRSLAANFEENGFSVSHLCLKIDSFSLRPVSRAAMSVSCSKNDGFRQPFPIDYDHLNTSAAWVESKLRQPARTRTSVRPHRERNWPWSFLESFCRRGRESPAYSERRAIHRAFRLPARSRATAGACCTAGGRKPPTYSPTAYGR